MTILVAIPAYNEERRIAAVVRGARAHANVVVVIDDASTDRTADLARRAGARVLQHIVNRDLGGALQTAFVYARKTSPDILITMDGDGQFASDDIPRLIAPLVNGTADVVLGSRFLGVNTVPFFRRLANRVANGVTRMLFGVAVTDSQSGFRAFHCRAFSVMELRTSGMEISSEIVTEMHARSLRYTEVPITVRYDAYTLSKGQGIRRGIRTFFALLLHRLER